MGGPLAAIWINPDLHWENLENLLKFLEKLYLDLIFQNIKNLHLDEDSEKLHLDLHLVFQYLVRSNLTWIQPFLT